MLAGRRSSKETTTLHWQMSDDAWVHWAQGLGETSVRDVILERIDQIRKNSEVLEVVRGRCEAFAQEVPGEHGQPPKHEIKIRLPAVDQQMVDAFPWDTAPRYLVRDRDQTYGAYFDSRVDGLGMEQVLTAPRSPWQNPFVERMIGSIRRECLDHVIVLDERHLKRILRKYVDYYHSCRTHLSLEKDAPEPRRVESPAMGKVRAIPKVGGLHHYYTRRAA